VIQPLPLDRVKFIAESGMNLALTRLWGRAPRRERVVDVVPRNYGPNVTILAALSRQGIEAVMTVEGATDADVFRAYVEQVLGPTLLPAEVVVMDNLSAHKVHGIREGIAGQGAQLLYLPPYSPDLSPIEPCWSNLKATLRAAKARTREALEAALSHALEMVTDADARGWFAHGGYGVQ
jgi:transposase